ncbi:MAG: phosphatidate cytidylyltransferase [Planctomycetota bacterium]
MASPKAARILKRTAVGGSLVCVLSAILWWTSQSSDGKPVLITVAIVLVAAALELSRMGKLAALELRPTLLVASFGALMLGTLAIQGDELRALSMGTPREPYLSHVYEPTLAIEYGFAALLAASAFAWTAIGLPRVVLYGIAVLAMALYVGGETHEVASRLKIAAIVLAIWVVATLPMVAWVKKRARDLLIAIGLAVWIVPPLPALWAFWREWGMHSLVALLVLSKCGDTFGYYVGNAIGKRHPFPNISPGKTVAGCVGSLVGAAAVGGVLAHFDLLHASYRASIASGLVGGALINVAAQAGDLLESWVKRKAGVKDSSTVFGPSGGVLDQIDSLLLTVPVASLIWFVVLEVG